MNDARKTTAQLIDELAALRQRVAALETLEAVHQQAEAALREHDARTHAILHTSIDGIITINAQGCIESFNPAAERLFGYSAAEIMGQNVAILMPAPYSTEHDGYLWRYLSTGEKRIIGMGREVIGQRKDGTTFPMDLAVSEVRLGAQRLFTGIVRDLTERQHTEATRRDSEARLRAILEAAIDGIITIDECGHIESFNPAAERLFGYAVAEVMGQNITMLMPAPYSTEHDGYLRRYLSTGEKRIIGVGREVIGQRKDGTTFPMDLAVSEVRLGAQRLFTGSVRDLTVRKQAEQKMQRADRLALVGQVAAGLAHEIGTPLNVIEGNAELLRLPLHEQGLPTTEVDTIIQQADRITRLLQRLLTFARPQTHAMEPVSLSVPLAHTLRLLELRFRQEAITVVVDMPAHLPLVLGAADEIEQVFLNVLVNAWHALPVGGVVTIQACEVDGQWVHITFRDTGVGMAAATLERVFEPFYSTKGKEGTGLGLAICRQIVDSHGGTIRLDSTPGEGTTVTIALPRAAAMGQS